MNKLIVAGLALTLLAGGALAQTAAPAPAPVAPPMGAKAPPPPPPPPGDAAMDDGGPGAPPPPPGGPHGHHPPPPPPSKAAHFRLEHGDTALDVKCAEDESMKACADIALQLLDKVQVAPKP